MPAPPQSEAPLHSDVPTLESLIIPKWTRPEHVPTDNQIRQWVTDARWDKIIKHSNPAEYSRLVLPKARGALRHIAISLGECRNYEGATEALSIMLSSFYWDIRAAAITSLAKIGDHDTLAFLEGVINWNWNSFNRECLKTCIAYLSARLAGKPTAGLKEDPSDDLARAMQAHDRRQYGLARFLLEGLMTEITEDHTSYLRATVALARSCAEMNDTKAAIEIIKPVVARLAKSDNRSTVIDVRHWLWNDVVFENYDEEQDDIYKWGLNLDLSLALSATTTDEVLWPLRNLTRWLETLGVRSTAQMIRDFIRAEAPESRYVDEHDRINYFRNVMLSESMQYFFHSFANRVKAGAFVRLQKVMGKSETD